MVHAASIVDEVKLFIVIQRSDSTLGCFILFVQLSPKESDLYVDESLSRVILESGGDVVKDVLTTLVHDLLKITGSFSDRKNIVKSTREVIAATSCI